MYGGYILTTLFRLETIEGTVNDAAKIPDQHPTHGSYHWSFERLLSVALVPLTVAPFAAGHLNPIWDAVLCATILIHSHIGFEYVVFPPLVLFSVGHIIMCN
jgi:succinate dehydrogenase (ubiquinone) membrane anchor subunit